MISNIWSALTIVRHAVAITIVMSAAGATVAGSVHGPSGDHASQVASSATTAVSAKPTTIAMTGEFEHQSTLSVNEPAAHSGSEHTTKNEPKTVETAKPVETKPAETQKPATVNEPKHETAVTTSHDETLSILVKDCLTKYAAAKTKSEAASLASEACRKAIAASGLSSNEFWARFGPKTTPTKKPEPTKRPDNVTPATTMTTAQLEVLVKDCFAKYLIVKNTKGGDAAVEACHRAMAASGLTGDAFWAKFGRPGTN